MVARSEPFFAFAERDFRVLRGDLAGSKQAV